LNKLIVPSKSAVYLNNRKHQNFHDSSPNNTDTERNTKQQNHKNPKETEAPRAFQKPSKSAVYLNNRNHQNFHDSSPNNTDTERNTKLQNHKNPKEPEAPRVFQAPIKSEINDVMKESMPDRKRSSKSSSSSNSNKVFNNLYNQGNYFTINFIFFDEIKCINFIFFVLINNLGTYKF